MSDLSEIDEVRWQRDKAKSENVRLREENERLRMLLSYADAAAREEYRLRLGLTNGTADRVTATRQPPE